MQRVRGLDGLRAVAVVAVLLYHADLKSVPGGFLGVDIFFQMIAIGLIIVLAVEADVLRGRLEARARSLQAASAL